MVMIGSSFSSSIFTLPGFSSTLLGSTYSLSSLKETSSLRSSLASYFSSSLSSLDTFIALLLFDVPKFLLFKRTVPKLPVDCAT
jgi:hypothetical protein